MNESERPSFVGAAKAFALFGILLSHVMGGLGSPAWFTNPGTDWPDFSDRISQLWPQDFDSVLVSLLQFLGWLGDAGPGVFILLVGFGLAWSALGSEGPSRFTGFLRRMVAKRYPLYLASHFVLLAVALAFPLSAMFVGRRQTLFSLLGLRFTETGFLYLNPSWWLVWTLLQLCLIFPILFKIQKRWGPSVLLGASLVLTIAFRGMGWAGFLYPENLNFWMTGIFAGTRLAEFTLGMVLAQSLRGRAAGEAFPGLSLAIVHHTGCGWERVADPDARSAFGAASELPEAFLEGRAITDHEQSVRADIERLRASAIVPDQLVVSGHVYEVDSGRLRQVAAPAPLSERGDDP